jgi:hypothetical protein
MTWVVSLVCAGGGSDLGDGHTGVVDHGGEQSELDIRISPDTARDRAVDRKAEHPVMVTARVIAKPPTDDPIEVIAVHSADDPADGFLAGRPIPAVEVTPPSAQSFQ